MSMIVGICLLLAATLMFGQLLDRRREARRARVREYYARVGLWRPLQIDR